MLGRTHLNLVRIRDFSVHQMRQYSHTGFASVDERYRAILSFHSSLLLLPLALYIVQYVECIASNVRTYTAVYTMINKLFSGSVLIPSSKFTKICREMIFFITFTLPVSYLCITCALPVAQSRSGSERASGRPLSRRLHQPRVDVYEQCAAQR